ncbi:hypothetical protein VTK73DRAFT_10073 [Phialemonium thermophilum]|uniref:Velvet domain-containing protein n=1 Tax=Phialemonium thermophilum TaxID=223376 RepID=A0ABR3XI51_9PEZI
MGASVLPAALGPAHDDPHFALSERFTKDGRKLYYKLSVIQQPERARACGSGPKSSADRRPVDPPPVVELRIFEGQTWQEAQQKDITFLYNANFFLFATLEHARIVAHGRVQTPAANQPPVLTGMPVSGMAYLDRPVEAGYFLFPDLSVRHEGCYRLRFNLYEQTKEERDKDSDDADSNLANLGVTAAAGGSFDFRMEVKSHDFVVYSAKKFPGLSESTQLSRVVAEQGCRVRIRRDVRMRRRDRKGGADHDGHEDEFSRKRTETPEARSDSRTRSMSGSVERTPYNAENQRRPSGVDYPPHFSAHQPSSAGHLQFFAGVTNSQYPQPQAYPQPSSMPPSPSYQSSQGAPYSHPSHPPTFTSTPQPSFANEPPSAQPYAPRNPSPRRELISYRRPSDDFSGHQPPQQLAPHPEYTDYSSMSSAGVGSKVTLPPIDVPKTPAPIATNGPPPSRIMPPLPSPTNVALPQLLPHPGTKPAAPTAPSLAPLMAPPVAGSKRTRDESFRYETEAPRYHNGAREDPQETDSDEGPLVYSRADGSRRVVSNHFG